MKHDHQCNLRRHCRSHRSPPIAITVAITVALTAAALTMPYPSAAERTKLIKRTNENLSVECNNENWQNVQACGRRLVVYSEAIRKDNDAVRKLLQEATNKAHKLIDDAEKQAQTDIPLDVVTDAVSSSLNDIYKKLKTLVRGNMTQSPTNTEVAAQRKLVVDDIGEMLTSGTVSLPQIDHLGADLKRKYGLITEDVADLASIVYDAKHRLKQNHSDGLRSVDANLAEVKTLIQGTGVDINNRFATVDTTIKQLATGADLHSLSNRFNAIDVSIN